MFFNRFLKSLRRIFRPLTLSVNFCGPKIAFYQTPLKPRRIPKVIHLKSFCIAFKIALLLAIEINFLEKSPKISLCEIRTPSEEAKIDTVARKRINIFPYPSKIRVTTFSRERKTTFRHSFLLHSYTFEKRQKNYYSV